MTNQFASNGGRDPDAANQRNVYPCAEFVLHVRGADCRQPSSECGSREANRRNCQSEHNFEEEEMIQAYDCGVNKNGTKDGKD